MMVVIKKAGFVATWDGQRWVSADANIAGLLNAVTQVAAGYLPAEVNVRAMIQEAFGNDDYETLHADSEPVEPGVVY